ncbi:MAG: hypothetical protein AAB473_01390 [Patescibacteria group bacterium]
MSNFFVYGIPSTDRPDHVLQLKRAIIAVTLEKGPAPRNKKEPISVFFPRDLDGMEIGEHILVMSDDVFTYMTDEDKIFRDALLGAVRAWAEANLSRCSCIKIELPYSIHRPRSCTTWIKNED